MSRRVFLSLGDNGTGARNSWKESNWQVTSYVTRELEFRVAVPGVTLVPTEQNCVPLRKSRDTRTRDFTQEYQIDGRAGPSDGDRMKGI